MNSLTPNAQRLLRSLVVDGPAYRADLARTLDVSRATVTNLANRLSADGWIEETDPESGALKILVGTTPRLGVLASVMFLVETCTVTIATLDGRVLSECTLEGHPLFSTTERLAVGADFLERRLIDIDLSARDLHAIHLAVDTQMDALSGEVYAQRASSRWYGVNPKQHFANRFRVPVHAQNTARLEGLAEFLWGVGRGHSSLLYIDASYGITAGHIIDGVIQSGARGGSGELGHIVYDWNGPLCTCGNPGCLMQYASIPAMLRDINTGTGQDDADWGGFIELVRERDPAAKAIADRAMKVLGRMLVNICHMIDPEILVLSGEIPRAIPGFTAQVAAVLREHTLPLVGRNVQVCDAELGYDHTVSARAGIYSLRAVDAIVTNATNI